MDGVVNSANSINSTNSANGVTVESESKTRAAQAVPLVGFESVPSESKIAIAVLPTTHKETQLSQQPIYTGNDRGVPLDNPELLMGGGAADDMLKTKKRRKKSSKKKRSRQDKNDDDGENNGSELKKETGMEIDIHRPLKKNRKNKMSTMGEVDDEEGIQKTKHRRFTHIDRISFDGVNNDNEESNNEEDDSDQVNGDVAVVSKTGKKAKKASKKMKKHRSAAADEGDDDDIDLIEDNQLDKIDMTAHSDKKFKIMPDAKNAWTPLSNEFPDISNLDKLSSGKKRVLQPMWFIRCVIDTTQMDVKTNDPTIRYLLTNLPEGFKAKSISQVMAAMPFFLLGEQEWYTNILRCTTRQEIIRLATGPDYVVSVLNRLNNKLIIPTTVTPDISHVSASPTTETQNTISATTVVSTTGSTVHESQPKPAVLSLEMPSSPLMDAPRSKLTIGEVTAKYRALLAIVWPKHRQLKLYEHLIKYKFMKNDDLSNILKTTGLSVLEGKDPVFEHFWNNVPDDGDDFMKTSIFIRKTPSDEKQAREAMADLTMIGTDLSASVPKRKTKKDTPMDVFGTILMTIRDKILRPLHMTPTKKAMMKSRKN